MIFGGHTTIIGKATGMLRAWPLRALTLLMLVVAAHSANAADAAKGEALFGNNCARCHSAKLEKASTGPALLGVSSRIPKGDWRYRWVQNSGKLIGEGDAYALKVWNENAKASMDPMPHLTNADIDDIFAFLDGYVPKEAVGPTQDESKKIGDDEALSGLWGWIQFLIFIIVVLLGGIAFQLARLRGVEFLAGINLNRINARLFLAFYILGMIGTFWLSRAFAPYYIQSNSASVHGAEIDQMFWITMVVVMGVFVITNGILFFFAWKYGKEDERKAKYYPENHKLELIWTVVPAIVLTVLVIFGIRAWTNVMRAPEGPTEAIEVSGQQWGWILRYPGDDNKFGAIDVRNIGGDNILGVDVNDPATKDDFISNDLVLMEDMTIDLKIRSRDVLHSVYLPHFRVKMDAVPGMDTRFHFVPRHTTDEYRDYLKSNPIWNVVDTILTKTIPADSSLGPDAKPITVVDTVYKYETFDYELACTEVCGRGHFSMRKKVVVLKKEEWLKWYDEQKKSTMLSQMQVQPQDAGAPKLSSNAKAGEILDNN